MSNVGAMDAKLAGLEGIQAILDEVGKGDDDFGVISDKLHKVYDALQMLNDQTGHAVLPIPRSALLPRPWRTSSGPMRPACRSTTTTR